MKSQIKSTNKGFTLIEVLVVVGLLVTVFAIGALTNVGMYTRELSRSEQSDLFTVLQQARDRAMNNVNATTHGVYFGNDIECYYVFEGTSYGGDPCEDSGNQDRNINITSAAAFEEVYFEQLSGNPSDSGDITMTDTGTGRERIITIQENGLIISQPPTP
jgi:prepilin-type N-terminal cleavage/methylation domain-containing protein